MTEIDPQPEAREPFADAPLEPGAGCGKPLLVGCGVVVLLAVVTLVLLAVKGPDLLAWALERSRVGVLEVLPEDVTPQEAARLEAAFDAAIAAVRGNELDPDALRELQSVLLSLSARGSRLTRDDVLRLTRALERVGGVEGEANEAEPAGPGPEGALTAA